MATGTGGSMPSCAELLIQYLGLEGVTHVFGLPGSANAHTLLALGEAGRTTPAPTFVVCRHETGAAYAADGWARVTGGLATVLVTAGPGGLNALTGVVNAHTSRTPMLVLSGEVSQTVFGKAFLQEGVDADLDVDGVYANAVRSSDIVSSPDNFPTLLTRAIRAARSLPGGAAHLSLPDNVMAAPATATAPASPAAYRVAPAPSDRGTMSDIAAHLQSASYPLIYLGNAARAALQDPTRMAAFTAMVERLAIPVMTSPNGKGIFPESHDLSLRNYGMAQCEWPKYYLQPNLLAAAGLDPQTAGRPDRFDALLVLGSELGELATFVPSASPASAPYTANLVPTGMFAHVSDNQSVIGREYAVTHGVVAESGKAIDELVTALADGVANGIDDRRAFVAHIKQLVSPFRDPTARTSPDSPVPPPALMAALQSAIGVLDVPVHVWVDAGNCVGWCLQYLEIDPPSQIHSALAMGPMGFAVGATVGGAIGDPTRLSIGVVGDGAFLMHGAEISTAVAQGVGAVWVVLDDDELLMVSQGMQQFFPNQGPWGSLYTLGKADLAKVAEGYGATAYEVSNLKEATEAIVTACTLARTEHTPQVVVARIDAGQVPPYYAPPST